MSKTFCVYKHTCLKNGKVYIGITSQKPETRWGCDGYGYHHNIHFTNAIKKYGWDNFKHEILFTGLCAEDAERIEIDLISSLKSNNREFGYNISSGGDPGNGTHCSAERKAKIRAGRLGYKCSEETKRKISAASKKRSPETIKKIADSRRGKPSWNKGITGEASHSYGVVFSEERRRHISEATTGKPKTGQNKEVLDTQTGIVYRTARDAAEAVGLTASAVRHHCQRQTERSHRFKYLEKEKQQ